MHLQFKEYLQRAEDIKALINGQQPVTATTAGGAQKVKPAGGPNGGTGGGNGADVSAAACLLLFPCSRLVPH